MASSLEVDTNRLHEWHDRLRSINFWLDDGYLNSPAYRHLEEKLNKFVWVMWNVGVGPAACFTRAISSITRELMIKRRGSFDHVIEVDMKRAAAQLEGKSLSINDVLHLEVAQQLGLLDQEQDQEYNRLKEKNDEVSYYAYGTTESGASGSLKTVLRRSIVFRITQKLSSKRYMVVVENLEEPIKPIQLHALTEGLWLPPPDWATSFWLVSTTTQDVYQRSKPQDYPCVIESFSGDDMLMLTLYSLKQAAKYISGVLGQHEEDEEYCHRVAIRCFHYATMMLIPRSSEVDNNPPDQFGVPDDVINSDKLIYHWASQGILKQSISDTADGYHNKYNGDSDDIYQVGNVIIEAFQEYSLLQLPCSPAKQGDEAIKTAAHFLAYHSLIAEHLTLDELFEDHNQPGLLGRTHWISHVGGQGWHLSRDWLGRQGCSGPTALVIKHCSQQSKLFTKFESDHFFAKLPYLRVLLDLSYTPIKSLPPSICSLQELQYLSLRGCYNLTSPFNFPNTKTTLNLLFFDLSYSNISKFHCDFFYSMPKLQALVLVMCSILEELPPSIAVLSSLRSFSLIGAPHMKQLSLCGCRKLEYVDIKEVGALEELDLSATAIKELPDSIPNLPQLRQFLLLGVPSLRRFPWHKLQRLPNVFCLDQCSNSTINHSDHPQGAQVCVSDSRLFYRFNEDTQYLVWAGKLLKTFYVRVTSCKTTSSSKLKDEGYKVMTNTLQLAPAAYNDINRRYLTDGVSMVSMDDVPPCLVTKRHVEISAADRYAHGLKYLLSVTKSISISDDTHVSCLSDLGDLDELEECKLRRCHKTVHIFSGEENTYNMRRNMKNACVSHLRNLTHFFSRTPMNYRRHFYALKHLVLEYCPRLEGVVPCGCELQKLETLDIHFCYNLKAIFYDTGYSSSSGYELPCLRRISLQELPLLEHLDVDNPMLIAPAWKELHVRGCWSLRSLPRFHQQPDTAVKVSGERAWWNKLRWDQDDNAHRDSYEPMLSPAFASRRERVVIKSYLR